jgi:hypothetical protein
VNEEEIKTLPLNGRNFVNLTRTIPGVVRGIPGANIDGGGSLAWRASSSFSANGQRPRDNNYMLDGVDNNETWLQTVVLFPSVDALDEFKVQTSTYSAEFGRSLGGVVNLQIKSGTNAAHGSGYEFLRNDAFDSNNFFNIRANRAKPEFSQHQFGGHLRRPDRQGQDVRVLQLPGPPRQAGQHYLSTVPSEKMRAGDFSELNRIIYDPLTGQPFPNNQIPTSRFNPTAKNILDQLIPTANTAGTRGATGQTIQNYLINPNTERQDNQIDTKFDHQVSQNNRFFTRYSYQKTHRLLPATLEHGDAGFTFGAGDGNIKAQGLAFNDTHTFGSHWLNEFRFGWTSIKFFMTPIDYGTNIAQKVGIPGANLGDTTSAMSQIMFNNGGMRNIGSNGNQPLITNQNDFQFFDNVTRVAGKHTMRMGGSITKRSREILNADTDRRPLRLQPEPDVELRRHHQRLHHPVEQRVRFRQLPARLRQQRQPHVLRSRHLHRAAAGILDLLPGRHPRDGATDGQRRPALRPLRAVGREGRQAGELRSDDGQVRGRVRRCGDRRGESRPVSADLREDRLRSAPRVRLRPRRRRPHDRPRRLRDVLELHARRHLLVEGAEPAVPAGAGPDDQPRDEHHPVERSGRAARRASRAAAVGQYASAFSGTSATRTRTTST